MAQSTFFRENLAKLLDSPSRESLRELLKNNYGEFTECDFKEKWPADTSLAKHILAMANSGGGIIIVGVRENDDKTLDPVGLTELPDKEEIYKGVRRYLPNVLWNMFDIGDFSYRETEYEKIKGKNFQIMPINYDPSHLPFLAERDGTGIKSNVIYVRRKTSSTEANHDEVQGIISARIDTGHSSTSEISLKEHIDQLRVLYEEIPKFRFKPGRTREILGRISIFGEQHEPNPHYPQEDID